ncbi:MAG: integrin alpha [Planctomycetota bacterium]
MRPSLLIQKNLPLHIARLSLAALACAAPAAAQLWESCNLRTTITGENAGDNFGWVGRNAGDTTGDGIADIVVGANGFGAAGEGRTYLFDGSTGALLWTVTGPVGSGMGFAVAGLGDLNGDGLSEVATGLPGSATRPGEAWILDGATGAVLRVLTDSSPSDQFGGSVDRAGDVDGDGTTDIVVGAPGDDRVAVNAGRAYVFSGATGAPLRTFDGEAIGDALGSGVGPVGDRDGDGFSEVVVAAMNGGPGNRGRAYVLDGAGTAPTVQLEPGTTGVAYGQFFCGACGDVDADGTGDFFVSDWQDATLGSQTGRVYVYSGATLDVLHEFVGERGGDAYGIGRGWAGDVDHDGHDDLHFASYLDNNGPAGNAGTGRVHSGATGALLAEYHGSTAGDALGFDADGLGDVNGDGEPDFLLTSVTGAAAGGTGLVFVISGAPAPPTAGCTAPPHSGGVAARLFYGRSTSLAAAEMRLRIADGVPNATFVPFYGFAGQSTPLGGGVLCAAGPLFRLPVDAFTAAGARTVQLDFAVPPLGAGPGAVTAGVPVHFQVWFRDTAGPGGANLTQSLVVHFCP